MGSCPREFKSHASTIPPRPRRLALAKASHRRFQDAGRVLSGAAPLRRVRLPSVPPYAGATAIAEGLQTKGPGMTSGTLRPRVPQFATRALTCDPHMRPPHVSHHMRPMNRPGRSGPCPSHAVRPVLPQSRNIRLSIQILRIPWRTRTRPAHAAPLVPRPRQAIPGRDICRGAAFMPICLSRRCFCHPGALPPLSCGTGHGRVR